MTTERKDPAEIREQIRTHLASVGAQTLIDVRALVGAFSKAKHPSLRRAGRAWSAALGAMVMIVREPNAQVEELFSQIQVLCRTAGEAWLAFTEAQARKAMGARGTSMVGLRANPVRGSSFDPAAAAFFEQLIETCALGRKAIREDNEHLARECARRMSAIGAH